MKILPVIDLLGGVVVRGVGGKRAEYRPIESKLCTDPSPPSVAKAFRERLGCDDCYVADLDAIAGAPPSLHAYVEIVAAGLQPWIDAGTGTVESAAAINRFLDTHAPQGRIVVGLESLVDMPTLARIIERVGPERTVFSLDLREGRPLTNAPSLASLDPSEIATAAITSGVRSLIVLDLAAVGMHAGVSTLELCRAIRARYPHVELSSGGGVRTQGDLRILAEAGCDRALVASALHDGKILLPRGEGGGVLADG
jgi:phosphoribosylformimino-5-aminoimidazole carboxamide ribotide isomerase